MSQPRQIARQLDLLRTLYTHRATGITTGELARISAEFYGRISRRTVERDLQDLLEVGFPLYSERQGRHIYWRILPSAALPSLNFTVLEIAALLFAEGMSDALTGTPFKDDLHTVCQRLRGTLSPRVQEYFQRAVEAYTPHLRGQKSYAGFQAIIDQLNEAILKRCICQVTYRAMGGDGPKTYPIEPLRLFYYRGGLYLISRAPAYDQLITQAVERIQDLQVTSQTFEPPANLPPEDRLRHSFGIIYEEPFASKVRFTPDQAPYVRERLWHPSQRIEEQEDGGLILHLFAGGRYELKAWVLSHGADAELLEPDDLRQEIATELVASLKAYQKKR
ncbi:MAG: WYL domain-containing transcriptional regulator [Candidatus Latescibacteria bacterium]|nr:WYL domain-containing transcriptional regulator [Candidatus Latescibacterota bacterium]